MEIKLLENKAVLDPITGEIWDPCPSINLSRMPTLSRPVTVEISVRRITSNLISHRQCSISED